MAAAAVAEDPDGTAEAAFDSAAARGPCPTVLPANGADIVNKRVHSKKGNGDRDKERVSLGQLFSLADSVDQGLVWVGSVAAAVTGAARPFFMIYFGKTLDGLNSTGDLRSIVANFAIIFVIVGAVASITGFVAVYSWTIAGDRQATRMKQQYVKGILRQAARMKQQYVKGILRQDMGWFDEHPAGQLPTLVTNRLATIADGIGSKIPIAIMNGFSCIGLFIVAFWQDPQLAAILLACLPLVGFATVVVTKLMTRAQTASQGFYAASGGIANEVFAGIRTVASLCAEPLEMVRYSKQLLLAEAQTIKSCVLNGGSMGVLMSLLLLSYSLAFWYGITQVSDATASGCTGNCKTGGKVVTAVFAVLSAAVQVGQLSPGLTSLNQARVAAAGIFATMDRRPAIDVFAKGGLKPRESKGELHIDNVAFHYPARPNDPVYHCIDIRIEPGESLALGELALDYWNDFTYNDIDIRTEPGEPLALVGPSGGGKSTMAKLLLRFYDPTQGCVRLDGTDIRQLNVAWYRQQVGYVGQIRQLNVVWYRQQGNYVWLLNVAWYRQQVGYAGLEPVLFSGTIKDNIASGRPGATEKDIVNAAKTHFSMLSIQERKVDHEKPDAAAAEVIHMTERARDWGTNLRPGLLAFAARLDNEPFVRYLRECGVQWSESAVDTMAENGRPPGTAANAHDFIKAFPKGYATEVGESGLQLSGGQKQRVAIARAIIKDPAILLLDEATSALDSESEKVVKSLRIPLPVRACNYEATSALDSESEKVVQSALDKLQMLKARTTVTIAHRLSTIQSCDRIAVIAGKGVEEIGTHAELTARSGLYAKLCELQGGGHSSNTLSTETSQQPPSAAAALMQAEYYPGSTAAVSAGGSSAAPSPANAAVMALRRQSSARESSISAVMTLDDVNGGQGGALGGGKGGGKGDKRVEPLAPLGRIWALQRQDVGWVLMGICGSILLGAKWPVQGVILAQLQSSFYLPTASQIQDKGYDWVLAFVGLAASTVVGHVIEALGFAVSGERLTRRMREMAFKAILRHDIGWFDNAEHAVGVLTTSLEADASAMARATGMDVGHKVQLLATIGLGVGIGLGASWQVGLVALLVLPMVGLVALLVLPMVGFAGVVRQAIFIGGNGQRSAGAMFTGGYGTEVGTDGVRAGTILGNALNAVSTVQAFNLQGQLSDRYNEAVEGSVKERRRGALANGVAFGYSQGVLLWAFALLFWFGSILVSNGTVTFLNFYMAMFAVVLGGMGIGHVEGDLGAQRAGRAAAARIFALVNDELKIDPLSDGGARPVVRAQGAIAYRNVHFTYPTRPEQAVYGGAGAPEGFSLDIGAGEMVALVGPSGSGKSTCIALLMRFYDVSEGSVELDGRNVKELNVHWLRSQVGYVGQEPVLFTGSIRDNIARGHPSATAEEIESAARAANAHDFVTAFAEGYDTDVGEKSALLSGGQKQRIAIARAILKNPAILLLDEATSALDNESERQVQAALDRLRALQKRTTLVVAHRLSTIRNADKIAVVTGGCVRELGSHDDLVSLPGGLYASLYNRQTAAFGH
ncbi:P-loop containing nucleoside triphosphate hydrolase protein [Tribonema minus]|uniref:P-loop containing nucleoside triphosphate hydrolase protein n=1 Tax=Tribonema minus TaxID=303371 RepID=A0A836CNL1_9STRA|nr:P-loop containing nucleoside triphosphate hydrolase protein [Tribonema minus]